MSSSYGYIFLLIGIATLIIAILFWVAKSQNGTAIRFSKILNKNNGPMESKDARTEGDGTEWIIEKDKEGKLFRRAIGSDEKFFIENK